MPQHKKSNFPSLSDGELRVLLIQIEKDSDDGIKRRERIQQLLSQMCLRAGQRGRPKKDESEEIDNAA